jgi:hypothetical protein
MELFWGKIIIFYGTITENWKKMYKYLIVISILNPDKSSYDNYHRMSFLMSQTWFVYFIDHFGAKNADFFKMKTMNFIPTVAYQYKSFESPINPVRPSPRGSFQEYKILND